MYFDPTYLIVIPAVIFAFIAQIMVKTTFNKYSSESNQHGYTAKEVARKILDDNGLQNISIEYIQGELTDHYDPSANVIRLSDSVYSSTSVAAIGVAAHEVGHAIQHAKGYAPIKVRQAIIPITRIGSGLAVPLVLVGMILPMVRWLIPVGIFLYTGVVFFQAVTLPVEFNASSRALKTLDENLILYKDEVKMAKKVLTAAAMTYVAAMFSSLMSLLRLILIVNGGRGRRR
ncbi:MAG: zinc metallopeptidase [Ruminococcus sp.]|nr:zinc metallopeptidase [Ruminococcus sp.]MCM1478543.1 zinc metallopeptidase [Muribaculaceae bacterium]